MKLPKTIKTHDHETDHNNSSKINRSAVFR